MRSWIAAFLGACTIGVLGCGPTVDVKASSAGQGGSGVTSSGAGGATGTTTPGVGGGSGGSDGGVPLQGAKYTTAPGFSDVVWDTKRNRVFVSSGGGGLVRVLDLNTGAWKTLTLGHRTEHMYFDATLDQVLVAIAVKEHSDYWFDVDQSGYMAVIDAATLTAGKLIHLPLDPWQIVANGAGYAYLSGASGQGTHMMIVNLATGSVTVPDAPLIRERTSLQLHPSKTHIYAATTDLSTNSTYRFNIDGETFASPYPPKDSFDHFLFGNLRMSPTGTTLFSASGGVFLATSSQETDMTWSAELGSYWRDLAFRPDGKIAYVVPDQDLNLMDQVYEPLLFAVDTASLQNVATYKLGEPAQRVLASEAGVLFVRVTLGGDPKTEVEVVPSGSL